MKAQRKLDDSATETLTDAPKGPTVVKAVQQLKTAALRSAIPLRARI
jgi:hypothetical protein